MDTTRDGLLIGVVGPCAAGKTTLVSSLKKLGLRGKHIAQEHSYVPDMWKRLTNPDILIFLEVTYPVSITRRNLNWTEEEYREQLRRLENAYQNADLIIFTDPLSPTQVLTQVLNFIAD